MNDAAQQAPPADDAAARLARRHLTLGWWALLVFLTLGMLLYVLHALDVAWYVSKATETRRLMWTLAHTHGTLLALLNVALGVCLPALPAWRARPRRVAAACLLAATLLFPAGFFLGGLHIAGGDPGAGVLLVPLGGVLLLVAVALVAVGARRR